MKAIRFSPLTYGTDCASDLAIGEMMETGNNGFTNIILRTYIGFISLTNPNNTWPTSATIKGRKLHTGEGITLIQE